MMLKHGVDIKGQITRCTLIWVPLLMENKCTPLYLAPRFIRRLEKSPWVTNEVPTKTFTFNSDVLGFTDGWSRNDLRVTRINPTETGESDPSFGETNRQNGWSCMIPPPRESVGTVERC